MINSSQFNIKGEVHSQGKSSNNCFEEKNIIKTTRRIIKDMNEQQKFKKAKAHVMDSLNYRHPRPQSQSLQTSTQFRVLYAWHTSAVWQWLLFLLGYIYMYLVILDNESYSIKLGLQGIILILFWLDTIQRKYIKTFDHFGGQNRNRILEPRTILLILMSIDLIVFAAVPGYGERPIRPFRILRCFIPMLYDWQSRRTFFSIVSTYTDILVYLMFFTIVVGGFALIGNRAMTFDPAFRDPLFPQVIDPYKSNYESLAHMIFVVYVVATYDSYPDNQIISIQNFEPNYIFFIIFIFMNMFLFSSIPGSLVYNKFRATHSKLILLDQIRQQHSLIIAFVTLAEDSKNLSFTKLIKFLNIIYRYKIRYVQYITDICLKIDDNNNKSIQVNEFMQLSQIILQNRTMLPPAFDDIQCWVSFRNFMKQRLKLKVLVQHWVFELIVTIVIILSFINALYFSFSYSKLLQTFDNIFVWIFFVQLLMRIIGIGPENFFADRWNNLDTFLVVIGVIFFFLPISSNASSVARIGRIFRVASLLRVISHSNFMKKAKFSMFEKLKMIFQVLLQIMPIILRFLPLFMFTYYFFGIIGMQVFYNSYSTQGSAVYNQYQQFSSFRTFIQTQYIMMQILTQAGWSMLAYDHCWRNPQFYGYIMIFFCFMHIIIVYVLATLIKGIFWEVYFTVNQIFADRDKKTLEEEERDQKYQTRTKQIKMINQLIQQKTYIDPDSVLKRQLYQNSLDEKIFHKLKSQKERQDNLKKRRGHLKQGRNIQLSGLISDFHIPLEDIEVSQNMMSKLKKKLSGSQVFQQQQSPMKHRISLQQIEQYSEQDIESEIEEMYHKVLINPRTKYNHIVGQSKIFNDFLRSKFVDPTTLIRENQFDLNFHPLYNKESMELHIYQVRQLLHIQTSKREQKAAIVKDLFESQIINQKTVDTLIKRKLFDKVFKIDTNGTLRRLFLSETSQQMIKKFQVEYFSQLYGVSFKEINKMTLGPLLKVEATLTYSLRNIMRYPMIDNTEFFEMITHIEDQYSNQVLKKGSLFKFVYKLEQDDTWFSVEFKRQQEMRVHFVKTGVWCYTPDMQDNQVYYARDAFRWDLEGHQDRATCQKTMKRFYESFEGLAFSLLKEDIFFKSNPKKYVYDLYVQSFDAEKLKRFKRQDHEISKVMVVILSKEELREELGQPDLPYELSDLVLPPEKPISLEFSFDDSENDVYQQLKNVSAADHEKIVQSQGLPFSYTLNLMNELQDTFRSYGHHFAYQIEKVYNDQFQMVTKHSSRLLHQHSQQQIKMNNVNSSLRVLD